MRSYPVFVVPTGIGCSIGGHAGDATPAMRTVARAADGKMITHPNVVNASALNDMHDGCLYVEGSALDRFLEGEINLELVRSNRMLVVVNAPATPFVVNMVNAARAVCGLQAEIMELREPFSMRGDRNKGRAGGSTGGLGEMIEQLQECRNDYDAVAIVTKIDVNKDLTVDYFRNGGVNPWGGVEAMVSRAVSSEINAQVAHAPLEDLDLSADSLDLIPYHDVVDPRMCAEVISANYAHCVLKGLQRAPRIASRWRGVSVDDVLCLVAPSMTNGRPHQACRYRGIPVVTVRGNVPEVKCDGHASDVSVASYLEAAGVVAAMLEGVSVDSVIGNVSATHVRVATRKE